jgi:hypothetical protein
MKCSVCGSDLGLWAKLTGHANVPVCKECREQANNRLQILVRSVHESQAFKLQYAEGWVSQFEEICRKYQMPEVEVGPLRFGFLNSIFKLIETEEEMAEADLKFLVAVSKRYGLGQSAAPEFRDTIFRIGTREIIQSWERGEVPQKECSGLVLQKGEVCRWEEGASLRVQKTQTEYVGAYSSISVPVPLIRGARFRVGGFKGHPIDKTVWQDGGAGALHVTNQRVCFTGQQRSVAIPYKKMLSIGGFDEGFIVQTSNEKKPGIFIVRHPELTTHLLRLASTPAEEESTPKKRSKKLAPVI